MKNTLLLFIIAVFLIACNAKPKPDAQGIIDATIAKAGGEAYNTLDLSFDFRGKQYHIKSDDGIYEFTRITKSDSLVVKDVVTNNTFQRFENDWPIAVPDSMAVRYRSSINSVQYFTLLPYGLNDTAVQKELLGEEIINGVRYYKVKVTFAEEGGGEDFEDVFIYWINSEGYTIDYLAYSYIETDNIGMRFRRAFNIRVVEGIRFVDYENYKPTADNPVLANLAQDFQNGTLKLLSKIKNEHIKVVPTAN